MKLKKHKVILRVPPGLGAVKHETVFLWDFAGSIILVKTLEPSGMYRISKMHRPDARTLWASLIRKGYEIIDMSESMQWNNGKNIWDTEK